MMDYTLMFIALIGGHCLADYALQGDFMAKAKNQTAPIPGVPWWQPMTAHSIIHGAFVSLITGIWWLGLLEAVSHFVIDDMKCCGKISYNIDQFLHIVFKVLWFGIAYFMLSNKVIMPIF